MEEKLKKLFEEAEKIALDRNGSRFAWAGSVRVEAMKAAALLAIAMTLLESSATAIELLERRR